MPSFYIFTCGISLIENLEKENRNIYNFTQGLFTRKIAEDFLRITPEKSWAGVPNRTAGAYWAVDWYSRQIDNKKMTAEQASFNNLYQPGDRIVFLTSDTAEGIFCALANAAIVSEEGCKTQYIEEYPNPKPGLEEIDWHVPNDKRSDYPSFPHVSEPPVQVIKVPGLAPESNRLESLAFGELIRLVTELVKSAREKYQPVIVYSGGYKLTLPILTMAAGWLGGIPMWALHENSDQIINTPILKSELDPRIKQWVAGCAYCNNIKQPGLLGRYNQEELKLKAWGEEIIVKKNYSQLSEEQKPLFIVENDRITLSVLGHALLGLILGGCQ